MAAAEGAVAAYADITGEDWKPYEAPVAPAASVGPQVRRRRDGRLPDGRLTDHGEGGAGRGSAFRRRLKTGAGFRSRAFFHGRSAARAGPATRDLSPFRASTTQRQAREQASS